MPPSGRRDLGLNSIFLTPRPAAPQDPNSLSPYTQPYPQAELPEFLGENRPTPMTFGDMIKAAVLGGMGMPRPYRNDPQFERAAAVGEATQMFGPMAVGAAAIKGKDLIKNVAGFRKVAQYLNPAELATIKTPGAAGAVTRIRSELPAAADIMGAMAGGEAKRGWYEKSRGALQHLFGDEADLFAGIVAATSPQNSVEMNLTNATRIYKNWVKAGRPTDRAKIIRIMGDSVVGTKGADSVLPAWINNTVSVLQEGKTLSGPKVDSFWANLRSRPRSTPHGEIAPDQAVTLDAWMANLFGMKQAEFAGTGTKVKLKKGDPGYSSGYLAGTSLMREAAAQAKMTPAEAQETAWSFGKALYEQSEATGMPAVEIIRKGLLDPKAIEGTPDFAQLLSTGDHATTLGELPDIAARYATLPKATNKPHAVPTEAQQKAMLKMAETLDNLRAMRGRVTNYKTGAVTPGSVIASAPLEAAPGTRSGVDPGFSRRTQGAQDARSSERLNVLEDLLGRNKLMEAAFPGQTAPMLPGRGHWANPETGITEANKLRTAPVQVRTVAGGSKLHPKDEHALAFAHTLQSSMLGQDQVAYSAVTFGKTKNGRDAIRIVTPNTVTDKNFKKLNADISEAIPDGPYGIQHRTNGIDIIRYDGQPMSVEERKTLVAAVKQRAPVKKGSGTFQALEGKDITDPDRNFTSVPWGPEGSRGVTTNIATNYETLTNAQKKAFDGPKVKQVAQDLVSIYAKNPQARQDHLTMLRIIAKEGVSGLARALKDPNQVLPVLAMLGISSAVASHTSRTPDAPALMSSH